MKAIKSKYGEGIGGPVRSVVDPNNPSYDPATCMDDTQKKIIWLCERAITKMTPWEKNFVMEIYGQSPLSRKQHITVWKIFKQYSEENP